MLARIVYFLLIGWWLGLLASAAAFLLCVTIIGIPIGVMIFNRLPGIIYLQEPGEPCEWGYDHRHITAELPFLLRVLWFFVIGWELGLLAVAVGYLFTLTLIGIPLGIFILGRVPVLMTLSRHYA